MPRGTSLFSDYAEMPSADLRYTSLDDTCKAITFITNIHPRMVRLYGCEMQVFEEEYLIRRKM